MKKSFYIFVIVLLPFITLGQEDSTDFSPQYPVGMTVDQFNQKLKTASQLLLVNFTADWCVVCKRQKPVLDQIMTELKGQVEFLIIDIESNPLIAQYFEVDGLPVLILYKGGDMCWSRVGFLDKTQLLGQVNPLINDKQSHKAH